MTPASEINPIPSASAEGVGPASASRGGDPEKRAGRTYSRDGEYGDDRENGEGMSPTSTAALPLEKAWPGEIPFGDRDQADEALGLIGDEQGDLVVQMSHRTARTADASWLTLMAENGDVTPRIMARGSSLVRMTDDGLETWSAHSLRDEMSRRAVYQRVDYVEPPVALAKTLLERTLADYWRVPRVDRVAEVPVLSASGSLITRPGYHENDRLYYRPAAGLEGVTVPDQVDYEDVVAARSLLMDELLGDFGFADQASRANALGLLLLPFVREFIGDEPTPMHAITANTPGAGKSMLAQACLIPACGLVPITTEAMDGDESRKRLTATLLRGAPAVVFDNLHATMSSPHLAAALTTGEWTDRRLGHTEELVLKVRNAWVATANNIAMTNEHARRTTMINLDPGEVRPSDRPASQFRHPDLLPWALAHRAELVSAALTLVRHWLLGSARLPAGSDEFLRDETTRFSPDRTLGSFNRWAEVVGGIVGAADVPGFLTNREQLIASVDVESDEDTAFMEAWHELLGEEPITSSTLAMKLTMEFRDVLPDQLIDDHGRERRLTYWLRDRKSRNYGDLTLLGERQHRNGQNPTMWRVVRR